MSFDTNDISFLVTVTAMSVNGEQCEAEVNDFAKLVLEAAANILNNSSVEVRVERTRRLGWES